MKHWSSFKLIRITAFRLVPHFSIRPLIVCVCVCVSIASHVYLRFAFPCRAAFLFNNPPLSCTSLFSQQPLQHVHMTALTEGCVFAGHRASFLNTDCKQGALEFPLQTKVEKEVNPSSSSWRSVCMCACTSCCSYMCAKHQESVRWPRMEHAHWTSVTLPLLKSFVYILEAMHFYLMPWFDGGWLSVVFFCCRIYIWCVEQ